MVEPKGGPVKPPILDLKPSKSSTKKPNPVSGTKSAAKTPKANPAAKTKIPPQDTKKPTRPSKKSTAEDKSFTPKSSTTIPSRFDVVPAAIGAIGGALLAIIILVPLILSGLLKPLGQSEITPLAQRITNTEELITQNLVGFNVMDEQVNALRERLGSQIDGLSAQTKLLDNQQKTFEQQQAQLLQNIDSISQQLTNLPASPDIGAELTPIQESISNLTTRLNAIAAGSTSEDAAKLGADIAQIQADFLNLPEFIQTQVQAGLVLQNSALKTEIEQIASAMTVLDKRLAPAIAAIEANAKNISTLDQTPSDEVQSNQNQTLQASLYLPLALMGMETALANGQRFDAELQSLALYLPSLEIPALVDEMSLNSRPLPSIIIENFNRTIPAMLSAKPKNPDAGWIQQLGDNMRSLLALRPVGQTEGEQTVGDQTENLVSQIEAAINRSDFTAAANLVSQLPPSMILALGELNSQILALGNANNLLNQARSLTLSQLATGQDIDISEPELNAQ